MPIKSFRGLIADDAQDTISLHTRDGSIGYRIVKMELMVPSPGTTDFLQVVKVFTVKQTTNTATINFAENELIAAGIVSDDDDPRGATRVSNVIFDSEVFNQDIYVTHKAEGGSGGCNYYIELEQVPLDLNENTVATLKDIRNETLVL